GGSSLWGMRLRATTVRSGGRESEAYPWCWARNTWKRIRSAVLRGSSSLHFYSTRLNVTTRYSMKLKTHTLKRVLSPQRFGTVPPYSAESYAATHGPFPEPRIMRPGFLKTPHASTYGPTIHPTDFSSSRSRPSMQKHTQPTYG